MKNRVKRIIGTVLFFTIGIYLFSRVSYVLRPTVADFQRDDVTGFYAEEEDSLDVVVMGSSSAYRYFNSMTLWEEYGIASYNFTTPGQSCFIYEYLIDEALKTQDPEVIVIEVRRFTKCKDKAQGEGRWPLIVNNMKYSWNRMKLITYLYDDWSKRMNNYFDILQYHDNWEQVTLDNFEYIDNSRMHKYHSTKIGRGIEP